MTIRPPVYPVPQMPGLPPTPPLLPTDSPVAMPPQTTWLPPSPPLSPQLSPVGDSFTLSSVPTAAPNAMAGVSQMDSMSPMATTSLVNGATGHFMQMNGQQKSVLSLMLPLREQLPQRVFIC